MVEDLERLFDRQHSWVQPVSEVGDGALSPWSQLEVSTILHVDGHKMLERILATALK